jgi:hypothetical protein
MIASIFFIGARLLGCIQGVLNTSRRVPQFDGRRGGGSAG